MCIDNNSIKKYFFTSVYIFFSFTFFKKDYLFIERYDFSARRRFEGTSDKYENSSWTWVHASCPDLTIGDRERSDDEQLDIRRMRVAEPGRVWARNKLSPWVGRSVSSASLSLFPLDVARPLPLAIQLSHSIALAIALRGRLFIPLRSSSCPLSPRQGVYNDSSWWDDTGSEVRTAEPDVHSMESLSSTGKRGSSLKEVAIHTRTRRSFQHEGKKIRFLRHSRERESRANSLEQRGKICARR